MDIPEFIKNIDIDNLISLVRERPVLWDKSLEEFKYKNISNAAWKDICIILYSEFDALSDKDKDMFGKIYLFIHLLFVLQVDRLLLNTGT